MSTISPTPTSSLAARRRFALTLAAAATAVASSVALPALAQTYPDKTIRLVVPFPPGGSTDAVGRLVAAEMSPILGQPVVVDNKGGANGNIGSDMVAKAAPDGYTLLLTTSSTHAISPHLMPKLAYDPRKDFTPVAHVADAPSVLLVTNSLPVKTVGELIAYAKAHPGKLNYATSGNGTIVHLNTAAFSAQAGVEMTHIPYKGTALAIPDLIAGQTHVLFDSLPTGMPHAKAGRLRALAVTSEKRSTLAPELPTLAESGLPGYSSVTWFGVYLPAGAPPALVEKVHKAFAKAVQAPEVAESLAKLGVEPAAPRTPAQFASMVQADSNRWAAVIRQHKITLE